MILLIDQSNKELELDEKLDFDINFEMHFTFSRDCLNELFAEKHLEVGKVARNLTDDECEDLIWVLSEYIKEQLYDMYCVNLEQDGYINEFISDRLPAVG